MNNPLDSNKRDQKQNPLISIGLVILAVLLIPPLIYSVGPKGPIKKDNVVFSTGHHRVYFADVSQYQLLGYKGFCHLHPRDQLLVLESAEARADGTYLARKIGGRNHTFPDCPSNALVILHDHHITLKPDLWGGFQDSLSQVFSDW